MVSVSVNMCLTCTGKYYYNIGVFVCTKESDSDGVPVKTAKIPSRERTRSLCSFFRKIYYIRIQTRSYNNNNNEERYFFFARTTRPILRARESL